MSSAPPPPPPPSSAVAPPPPPMAPGYGPPGAPGPYGTGFGIPIQGMAAQLDPSGIKPTVIVAGVILALFFGSQLVNAALPVPTGPPGNVPGPGSQGPTPAPGQTPLPIATPGPVGTGPAQPGATLDIGPLRVSVPDGWQTGQTQSGNFRMAKGAVIIDLTPLDVPEQADATTVCAAYINQALAPSATGFTTGQPAPFPISGAGAARASYNGVFGPAGEIEGQVTVFVVGQKAYVFDAWGKTGTLNSALPEIQRMFETVQVTGG